MKSIILWAPLGQTPSTEALSGGREGNDRIKSSNPFLQAVASAEETLEDRDTKDMSAQLRNGGCLTLFPAFPSPKFLPLWHTPQHWLNCLCHLLLLSGELWTVCSTLLPWPKNLTAFPPTSAPNVYGTNCSWRTAERLRKGGKGGLAEPYIIIETVIKLFTRGCETMETILDWGSQSYFLT